MISQYKQKLCMKMVVTTPQGKITRIQAPVPTVQKVQCGLLHIKYELVNACTAKNKAKYNSRILHQFNFQA